MNKWKFQAQNSSPMSWNVQKNRPKHRHRHVERTTNPSMHQIYRRQVINKKISINQLFIENGTKKENQDDIELSIL